jgi:hypothetical protein
MVVVLQSVIVLDFLVEEIIESTSFPFFEKKIALSGLQIKKFIGVQTEPYRCQTYTFDKKLKVGEGI